jgi:hypothetical protein
MGIRIRPIKTALRVTPEDFSVNLDKNNLSI